MRTSTRLGFLAVLSSAALLAAPALAAPEVSISLGGGDELAPALKIILFMTVLTIAPAIVLMVTSFTRIVVVLAFIRQAIGTQQMPPGQVLIGLALFLTVFVMTPVYSKIHASAVEPYLAHKIDQREAIKRAVPPLKEFMLRHTREKDILLFLTLTKAELPGEPGEVSLVHLVPAFMISELKTAFQIGFVLYIPFMILDLVVASLLLSMGMLMLPPVMVSLPLKLMLFVLVDGWNILVGSLLKSFG